MNTVTDIEQVVHQIFIEDLGDFLVYKRLNRIRATTFLKAIGEIFKRKTRIVINVNKAITPKSYWEQPKLFAFHLRRKLQKPIFATTANNHLRVWEATTLPKKIPKYKRIWLRQLNKSNFYLDENELPPSFRNKKYGNLQINAKLRKATGLKYYTKWEIKDGKRVLRCWVCNSRNLPWKRPKNFS